MEITGTSANDPFPTSVGAASGFADEAIDTQSFLELFVAQLQNQDPLEPLQNEQFVEQLATISSLEQLEDMNQNLVSMMALNQSNALLSQLTQSSALIGDEVSWVHPETGELMSGTVDTVRIVDGLAVLRVGEQDVPLAYVAEILGDGTGGSEGTEETGGEGTEPAGGETNENEQ